MSGRTRAADPPILIVEDKDSLRTMLRLALEAQGHRVVEARDQPEAEAALRASRPAVVLSDLRLTEGDGFGVLRASKDLDPELPVIVMTAFGSIQDAVAAMKEGALDFLAKPVDPDHLLLMVERALTQRRMATENLILKEELAQRRGAPQIVGDDPQLKQVSLALHRAAATDTTVLLEGESGTGKELFARALHALSPRADGPFVAINCAAIPETLLETELFGHEKGAFTGASARKPGKFELAHRGTLFLDEIGDLPLSLQAKILRALEEKEFERVGGTLPLKVDVRVVAATNRNLKAAVAARQYREDLYFRLSVFPILIPPLRERTNDIITLARYFIDRFCRELNKRPLILSPSAEEELLTYPWPGNVRELQNCIERAAILTEGDTIHPRHLSLSFRAPTVAPAEDESPWLKIDLSGSMGDASRRVLAEVERRKIEQALKDAAGNRSRAAEILQVSYKMFMTKLKEYGLDV
jgi:DNA-binding NtrC family response regulator